MARARPRRSAGSPPAPPLAPLNSNQSSQKSTTVVGDHSNSSTADNSPTNQAPPNNTPQAPPNNTPQAPPNNTPQAPPNNTPQAPPNNPTPQTSPSGGLVSDPQSGQTPTPSTARARLAAAVTGKKSRKRKKDSGPAGEEGENPEDAGVKQRVLDRLIRWNTFLYFTNDLWKDVIEQAYGEGVDMDSMEGQAARSKIFDCVKGFKNRVIENMEHHVQELLEAPEHERLTMYKTRDLLASFFRDIFTPHNFFHVWYYMDRYVEYEGSTELGQFYIRSIYTNLAVEVKLFLDQKTAASAVSDARQRLLRFYDTIPIHKDFHHVDKTQFKELNDRYRNERKKKKERNDQVLQDCYVSIGAVPKPGVVAVGTATAETDEA